MNLTCPDCQTLLHNHDGSTLLFCVTPSCSWSPARNHSNPPYVHHDLNSYFLPIQLPLPLIKQLKLNNYQVYAFTAQNSTRIAQHYYRMPPPAAPLIPGLLNPSWVLKFYHQLPCIPLQSTIPQSIQYLEYYITKYFKLICFS